MPRTFFLKFAQYHLKKWCLRENCQIAKDLIIEIWTLTHNSPSGPSNMFFNLQSKIKMHQNNVGPFKAQHECSFSFLTRVDRAFDGHNCESNSTWNWSHVPQEATWAVYWGSDRLSHARGVEAIYATRVAFTVAAFWMDESDKLVSIGNVAMR
jgi:hypothetical protein